jgi:hypothetical protein
MGDEAMWESARQVSGAPPERWRADYWGAVPRGLHPLRPNDVCRCGACGWGGWRQAALEKRQRREAVAAREVQAQRGREARMRRAARSLGSPAGPRAEQAARARSRSPARRPQARARPPAQSVAVERADR